MVDEQTKSKLIEILDSFGYAKDSLSDFECTYFQEGMEEDEYINFKQTFYNAVKRLQDITFEQEEKDFLALKAKLIRSKRW